VHAVHTVHADTPCTVTDVHRAAFGRGFDYDVQDDGGTNLLRQAEAVLIREQPEAVLIREQQQQVGAGLRDLAVKAREIVTEIASGKAVTTHMRRPDTPEARSRRTDIEPVRAGMGFRGSVFGSPGKEHIPDAQQVHGPRPTGSAH
jgi:hypothetical protein